ncbi:MAG: hypothetical protein MUF50_02640 [Planctomycetes bacterium]|jgi:hypothetical protein|nr:hypothetical protein [Planctomycetota bacterium]
MRTTKSIRTARVSRKLSEKLSAMGVNVKITPLMSSAGDNIRIIPLLNISNGSEGISLEVGNEKEEKNRCKFFLESFKINLISEKSLPKTLDQIIAEVFLEQLKDSCYEKKDSNSFFVSSSNYNVNIRFFCQDNQGIVCMDKVA